MNFLYDNNKNTVDRNTSLLLWCGISCLLLALPELEDGPQQRWLMNKGLPRNIRGDNVFLELSQLEGRLPRQLMEGSFRDGEGDLLFWVLLAAG